MKVFAKLFSKSGKVFAKLFQKACGYKQTK